MVSGREAARAGYGIWVRLRELLEKMLLRPVSESGTMRFPVKNYIKNLSVRYRPVGFHPITIYGNV